VTPTLSHWKATQSGGWQCLSYTWDTVRSGDRLSHAHVKRLLQRARALSGSSMPWSSRTNFTRRSRARGPGQSAHASALTSSDRSPWKLLLRTMNGFHSVVRKWLPGCKEFTESCKLALARNGQCKLRRFLTPRRCIFAMRRGGVATRREVVSHQVDCQLLRS
jgi:hypothetical protein